MSDVKVAVFVQLAMHWTVGENLMKIRFLCAVPNAGGDLVVVEVVKAHPRHDAAYLQTGAVGSLWSIGVSTRVQRVCGLERGLSDPPSDC